MRIQIEDTKKGVDLDKLEQVLHYTIHKVGGLTHVGKTVLYKLLYFCDFDYFELNEEYLTGERYRRLEHGPAPSNFEEIIKRLKEKGKICEIHPQYHGKEQIKFCSLSDPDISKLSAKEIKQIDDTLNRLGSMNATQISAYSHEDMPWKATGDKELIDYRLVFYRDPTFSVRADENAVSSD